MIFKACVSLSHCVNGRIYSYVTHRLTSAWQNLVSGLREGRPAHSIDTRSAIENVLKRALEPSSAHSPSARALVVLNYRYCCPDCGVRIELSYLF